MRIAAGGICHESSSVIPSRTGQDEFESGFGFYRGGEVIRRFKNTNVPTSGFVAGAEKHGFDLIPILWTFAYPYGIVLADVYEKITGEFLERLAAALPLDGVLLDQHGAMVAEGIPDADGDFIASVRQIVGLECPIVVTTDLHANHTSARVATADAIIGFDTYPHVDQAERGLEAADLIVRLVRRQVVATAALERVPMFWHPAKQVSGQLPWSEVVERLHAIEREPGVLTATVATGFPHARVPCQGPSVIVVTDDDATAAHRHARSLASWILSRRDEYDAPPMSAKEAIALGNVNGKYPVILADQADNTGGGAPGDSTEVLSLFLDLELEDALILYMVDPVTVAEARGAGIDKSFAALVGGRSHPAQGKPVSMNATVLALGDGLFTYDGPMLAGLTGDMGPSAAIRQGGVTVICVTSREQPLDTAFTRTLGIDCASMRYIAVKSAVHFRSGFAEIAGSIFNIDAAALHSFENEPR